MKFILYCLFFSFPALSGRDEEVSSKSRQIDDLLSQNEALQRAKVSLEMRAVDLEEQKDQWVTEKDILQDKIKRFTDHLKVTNYGIIVI